MASPKTSVLKTAESIFEQMLKGGQISVDQGIKDSVPFNPPQQQKAPDVPKVKITDDFLRTILESTVHKEVETVEEPKEEINEQQIMEKKLSDLVQKLTSLLGEAKSVINELTTCGMIGVGKAKGFKNGPVKSTKGNKRNIR